MSIKGLILSLSLGATALTGGVASADNYREPARVEHKQQEIRRDERIERRDIRQDRRLGERARLERTRLERVRLAKRGC